MTNVYSSTAIALLFGLGVAVSGAPAEAAGQDKAQQTAVGQQGEQQTGAQAGAETGTGQATGGSDYITADQVGTRADEQFDELAGGEEYMTREQFTQGMTGSDDAEALWGQIDRDQDDQLTREEWRQWREQGFAEAAGDEGRMSAQDYETWESGGDVGQMGTTGGATGSGGATTGGGAGGTSQ